MTPNLNDENLRRPRALIDGHWVSASTNTAYAVRNPATGDVKAEGEILYGASYVQRFAGKARRIHGDIVASSPGSRLLIVKLLMAVVACLSPWNFSNAMPARENAPALASGCTVVCKPADETPLSALAFGELAMRVEIPVGAINIISGRTSEIGAEPASTRKVRKLTLAGSTPVGKTDGRLRRDH